LPWWEKRINEEVIRRRYMPLLYYTSYAAGVALGLILCGDDQRKVVNPMIWTGGCKGGYMIVHGD
jgi:hypothetical protein